MNTQRKDPPFVLLVESDEHLSARMELLLQQAGFAAFRVSNCTSSAFAHACLGLTPSLQNFGMLKTNLKRCAMVTEDDLGRADDLPATLARWTLSKKQFANFEYYYYGTIASLRQATPEEL